MDALIFISSAALAIRGRAHWVRRSEIQGERAAGLEADS
jgi:hypothetical protein